MSSIGLSKLKMRFGVESKNGGEYVVLSLVELLWRHGSVCFRCEGLRFRSSVRANGVYNFSPVTFILTGGLRQHALNSQRHG